ncbi:MAG TPA: hypothetical protein VH186_18550 [Chloroflexia bacterium]|nr:hypothetical protein [Chloroflexia bacterium]
MAINPEIQQKRARTNQRISELKVTTVFLVLVGLVLIGTVGYVLVRPFLENRGTANTSPNVSDIANHPSDYYGSTVTINANITSVISQNVVLVGGEGFTPGGGLLVVSDQPIPGVQQQVGVNYKPNNENILVTGIVQQYNPQNPNTRLPSSVNQQLLQPYQGKPIIVASIVQNESGAKGQ